MNEDLKQESFGAAGLILQGGSLLAIVVGSTLVGKEALSGIQSGGKDFLGSLAVCLVLASYCYLFWAATKGWTKLSVISAAMLGPLPLFFTFPLYMLGAGMGGGGSREALNAAFSIVAVSFLITSGMVVAIVNSSDRALHGGVAFFGLIASPLFWWAIYCMVYR